MLAPSIALQCSGVQRTVSSGWRRSAVLILCQFDTTIAYQNSHCYLRFSRLLRRLRVQCLHGRAFLDFLPLGESCRSLRPFAGHVHRCHCHRSLLSWLWLVHELLVGNFLSVGPVCIRPAPYQQDASTLERFGILQSPQHVACDPLLWQVVILQ